MHELMVLVVDDEPSLRQLLSEVLVADLGVRVAAAADGCEALELARAEPPDLVLLDLRLPGVDGIDVLRQLRTDPATRSVPVIVVTAADAGHVEHAVAAGADDWIAKPFDLDDLCSRVALWAWRGARRARGQPVAPVRAFVPV
ncbi:MAG TPA: response regulator [Chloroflexota bacterium]|jgi:CheY-like chemotaxis protein|nr:response regulator [Chloroflexota bacterium]